MKLKRLNMLKKLNPPYGIPADFFESNRWQEIDDIHSSEILDDPKTPAAITLDSCDIKPVSFTNICHKTKVLKIC